MGRQGGDSMVVGSSIALLQERFRQLERVREKREERQLLNFFLDPEKVALKPQILFPPKPPLEDCLSLGLDSQSKHADFRGMKTPAWMTLWSSDEAVASTSRRIEHSEVDTSLRL